MKLSINKTLLLTAFLVLLSVAVIASITIFQSRKVKDTARSVSHNEKILRLIQKIIATTIDSETGARGYLITGNQKFLEPLRDSENNFSSELNSLRLLLADYEPLEQKFDSLRFYVNERIGYSRKMVTTKDELGIAAAVDLVENGQGKLYTDRIRRLGDDMENIASTLLFAKQKANNNSIQQLNILQYGILLSVVLAGLYFILYIKNNIEKRRQVQKELELLSKQIEDAHDAIFVVNEKQEIASWNHGAEKLYGYTKAEALGKNSTSLLKTDISSEEIDAVLEIIHDTDYWTGELKRTTKNGEDIFVRTSTTTIRNNKRHVTGYVSVSFDISLQKKAEEQLKRSNEELEQEVKQRTEKILKTERQFRNTLDNMLEAAQLIGFDMKYIYVNDAASKQGKYTKEQMTGKHVLELYPGFDQTELYKHFQKCMTDRVPVQLEHEFEFPDKTKNWFDMSLQPVPEGIFILSVDITDRKQAEAKRNLFTSIVNSSDDAIFSRSLEGIITSWNHAAETIFGYNANEIVGENIKKLAPSHLRPEDNEIILAIKAGESVRRYETQGLHKNGNIIILSMSASPVRDEAGTIIGISTIARDITLENETKTRILQSEENLKTIFDNTSEGFVLLDTHAKVKAFNKTAEQHIFKNATTNLAVGKSIFDLVDPQRELFLHLLSAVYCREKPFITTVRISRTTARFHGSIILTRLCLNQIM